MTDLTGFLTAMTAQSSETTVNSVDHAGKDFIFASYSDVVLEDAPIDPSWIVSGNPVARSGRHSVSSDLVAATHVWECTAGSFDWQFNVDETVYILEGAVRVIDAAGNAQVLRPGSVAFFAAGSVKRWEIDSYVKKLAFCHRVIPSSLVALFKVRDKMREVWRNWS